MRRPERPLSAHITGRENVETASVKRSLEYPGGPIQEFYEECGQSARSVRTLRLGGVWRGLLPLCRFRLLQSHQNPFQGCPGNCIRQRTRRSNFVFEYQDVAKTYLKRYFSSVEMQV